MHEWRRRIRTRSTFSSNILTNSKRNAPPKRTRCPLPRPLFYLLPRSPTLSPAPAPLPFCLSVVITARFVLHLIPLSDGILTLTVVFQNSPIEPSSVSSIRSSQRSENTSTVSSRDSLGAVTSRTLSLLLPRSCPSTCCLRPDGSKHLAPVSQSMIKFLSAR
jgi:hypothetical protein